MTVDSGLTPPINPIVFIKTLSCPYFVPRPRMRASAILGCLRFRMLFRLWISPLDPLQIENKDSVQHGDEQQGNHRRNTKSTDLSVTKRLPQRPAVRRQREERDYRCTHRDQYWTQADNAGVEKRLAQTLAALMGLLNEVEQHNHVAVNHSNQAGNAKKSHEAERSVGEPEHEQRAHHAIWDRRKNDQWFKGVAELEHQGQKDRRYRDQHHLRQVLESLLLLVEFAADLQVISERKRFFQLFDLWHYGCQQLGRQMSFCGKCLNGDGAELLPAAKFFRTHLLLNACDFPDLYFL